MYVLVLLLLLASPSPWQNILSRWCYVLHRYRQLLRTDLLLTCSGACNAVLTYRLACSALAQPSPSRFKTKEHRSIVRTQSQREKREKTESRASLLHSQRHAPRRLSCLSLSLLQYEDSRLPWLGSAETRASPLKARSVQREGGRPPSHYCAVQRCNTVLVLELAPYILSPSPSLSLALLTHSSFYLVDNLTHHTKRRDRILLDPILSSAATHPTTIASTKYWRLALRLATSGLALC